MLATPAAEVLVPSAHRHDSQICVRWMQFNFTGMFATLANAAMGATLSPPFDPFKDDLSYLLAAYVFEDVGVSAYVVRPIPWPCIRPHPRH